MADLIDYERRVNFLIGHLGGVPAEDYITEFGDKIIPGFLETGIIPKSRLKYVSIFSGLDNRKVVRDFLRSLGIKHKAFWVSCGFEILVRQEDYNLYRLSAPKSILELESVDEGSPEIDTDITALYKKYKQFEQEQEQCLSLTS